MSTHFSMLKAAAVVSLFLFTATLALAQGTPSITGAGLVCPSTLTISGTNLLGPASLGVAYVKLIPPGALTGSTLTVTSSSPTGITATLAGLCSLPPGVYTIELDDYVISGGGGRAIFYVQLGVTICSSGSLPAGVYQNVNVTGPCTINGGSSGSVVVTGSLTILPGASLIAEWGGVGAFPAAANLTVEGNLDVQEGSVLVLGCEPTAFICTNDPDQTVGSYATMDTVGGSLTAENALAVVVHHTVIGGNVSVSGGGGGVACVTLPLLNNPPYGDFEDNSIGGNLNITGWQSCWLGWFRNTVLQNVNFNSNVSADPDGSEMGNNTVIGNLNCAGNIPSPQIGDSMAGPTIVLGTATGQCIVAIGTPGLVSY